MLDMWLHLSNIISFTLKIQAILGILRSDVRGKIMRFMKLQSQLIIFPNFVKMGRVIAN